MNRNGAASIVLVFAVLCLSIFAVVSFVPALREDALITREVERVAAFYTADMRAEQILAQLLVADELPEYIDGIRIYTDIDWDTFDVWVWFAYPMNDTLELIVHFALDGMNDYTLLAWRVVHVGTWEIDGSLDVWQGFDDEETIFSW
ncbi:MAG: hypothetical protein FWC71_10220 [Defluviitaleaceae bacterium]|nr:hypothetical protein [Defluviitaleaceae bacterium]